MTLLAADELSEERVRKCASAFEASCSGEHGCDFTGHTMDLSFDPSFTGYLDGRHCILNRLARCIEFSSI